MHPIPTTQSSSRWKRFHLSATVVSAALLVAACGVSIVIGHKATDNVNNLYGGADGLQVVLSPVKVEAVRVAALKNGEDPDSQYTIGGAAIISEPIAVDEKTSHELAEILKNSGTYGWNFARGCKFDPGVAVRFIGKTSTIDVVLCFHCQELQVYRDDERVGGEDFDAASAQLAAIIRGLFPDDEEIQKM